MGVLYLVWHGGCSIRLSKTMHSLLYDLRFALRSLARRPGLTAVILLTLGLGIGATTAIVSVVQGVLLRPLPFADPERLVVVWETQLEMGLPKMFAAPPSIADWRQSDALAGVAAFTAETFFVAGDDGPMEVRGARVSAELFEVLGVAPARGRGFTAAEDRPDRGRVAVLGDGLWRRRFGADPEVVGRTVTIDEESYQVIGVMPEGFSFPPPIALEGNAPRVKAELWAPLALDYAAGQRGAHYLTAVARLAEGIDREGAQAELTTLAAATAAEHPESNAGWSVTLAPLEEEVVERVRPALLLLLGAVGMVLLIACVNVANLLLALARERERELAVRQALGAGAGTLLRQVLTESALLGLLGGAVGVLLAGWGVELLLLLAPADVPRLDEVRIDAGIIAFTLLLSLATGLLFGAAPALQGWWRARGGVRGTRSAAGAAGAGSSRATGGVGSALVAAEVALALVLLVGTGILARGFLHLRGVDPGFAAEGVLTARLTLPRAGYDDPAARALAFDRIQREAASLPGVRAAGLVYELPLDGDRQGTSFTIDGEAAPESGLAQQANFTVISPGYLAAMGVPLVAGRAIEDRDRSDAEPVVVVNETLARRFFEGGQALDRRLALGFDELPRRIVGVVADVRHDRLDREGFPGAYVPYAQVPFSRSLSLAVLGEGEPEALAVPLGDRLRAAEPDLAVYDVRPMREVFAAASAHPRFSTLLLSVFAGAALLLAAVGIYGVVGYSVRRRTREIGVRVALGAAPRDVARLVLGRGMAPVALGVVVGIAACLALVKALDAVLAGMLFGLEAIDPTLVVALTAFLAAVAAVACWLPARRALAIDPRMALQEE